MPKARLLFLQSSIVGYQSRQGPLALAAGKSSSPPSLESVFTVASLPALAANPVGRKKISLSVRDCTKGKNKKQFKLKI